MSASFTRRDWLKASVALTAGAAFSGITPQEVAAATADFRRLRMSREAQIAADMPVIKARLFANENPWGPSEKVKNAITGALNDSYMYPFMAQRQFVQMIAKEEGITPDHIIVGAGSSEMLMAAAMYYSKKGGDIISADPTYDYLMEMAAGWGANWVKVPLTKDYTHDLDAMEKRVGSNTRLMYVCNPNNPTGTIVQTEKLRSFCESVSRKVPVFIDEAYIDYLGDIKQHSMVECVRKGQNVIVARTFSKVHGFAGLRVGYLIAKPEIIKELEKLYTGGMDMSSLSIQGAMVSYQDKEFPKQVVQKTTQSREFLYKTLKDEGYEYVPSYANFVIFPVKMDAKKFTEEMMKRGVGVRNWQFNNKQWCRISIGTMEQMQIFAQAFKEIS
ncbi:histidinol-phosphate transaminase [Xanthocytophaga agilis]|uniref:histidinol-phosphate transaminase n=1 Tax=Xanthocytophaga agilis TaxID=3048010 RepID=A0AAE3R483_9BACT|nr:histidinol-phosphate transaminase [Xanthocytophaga agilis]MDJ1500377.1 histidinol-phosphate transaminase [Xanthocytophaga agilis]